MKDAGENSAPQSAAQDGRTAHQRRVRLPWWLIVAPLVSAVVFAICLNDAMQWVGKPFAGFLFGDGRIVYSLGRSTWRPQHLRHVEWGLITAVNDRPVHSAMEVHDAVAAAGIGGEVTYTLRRDDEAFRVTLPALEFSWADFAEVFAPLLGVGAWLVLVSAVVVVRRPDLPEVRALFATCVAMGLTLITGPDQYGPYRFTWLFFLVIAPMPPALLQLTAAILSRPGRSAGRFLTACYALFITIGVLLVAYRTEPRVFLPLLYLVYCALANSLFLYAAALISALVSSRRPRAQVVIALLAILVSAFSAIVVMVTYPLRTDPISVPWFVLPIGAWPVLSGIAFVSLSESNPIGETE